MKSKRLTDRELAIMLILWNSDKPMTASEIVNKAGDMTINIVQGALPRLLNKEYVCVADIIHINKVYGRTYKPAITQSEYMLLEFQSIFPKSSRNANSLLAAFIKGSANQEETLDEIEGMIRDYRKGLTK